MNIIAMIPARLGSQRLKQKNLQTINGIPLIVHAIRKCKAAQCFSETWVNTEAPEIGKHAEAEGVGFHRRPPELANNQATSEQFIAEFIAAHPCDYVVQVHSIAPLLSIEDIQAFVQHLEKNAPDVLLSAVEEQIECAIAGKPINFTFAEKTNSQELTPVQRISWSISAWHSETFLQAANSGQTATYHGKLDIFPVNKLAGHVIKTQQDLRIAEALWPLVTP